MFSLLSFTRIDWQQCFINNKTANNPSITLYELTNCSHISIIHIVVDIYILGICIKPSFIYSLTLWRECLHTWPSLKEDPIVPYTAVMFFSFLEKLVWGIFRTRGVCVFLRERLGLVSNNKENKSIHKSLFIYSYLFIHFSSPI